MFLAIISFLFIFAVVVLVHEGGHFFVAKACGVKVFEFSMGMGPAVLKYSRGGTLYTLRAFPLGGFVKIAGLDDEDAPAHKYAPQESFLAKPIWQRMLMIVAGPVMNVVIAFIIFTMLFTIIGVPSGVSNTVQMVTAGKPAEKAGILRGDKIVQVNDYKVEKMSEAIAIIGKSVGETLRITIDRGGEQKQFEIPAVFDKEVGSYIIGVVLAPSSNIRYNPLVAIKLGLADTYYISASVVKGIIALFTGGLSVNDMGGPVIIAKITGDVAKNGFTSLLQFLAFLSINLGIINLVPFPALDGGRLCFLLVEAIARRKVISEERENYIHYVGFVILIMFILFVTYNDIVRLIKGF